ncbi:hypothetical protein DFH09DRAFT_229978 [Mycena vulgaris]|nr:hypothetical protein DFH09DRAFT_229978 [Mycena vulgaris]
MALGPALDRERGINKFMPHSRLPNIHLACLIIASAHHSFPRRSFAPSRASFPFTTVFHFNIMTSSTFLILSFLASVYAVNDWTKPCTSGICSYDLPSTNGSASSGTIKIWGSHTAIGDITEAAGWEILDCSPNALSQDIRLVCMDDIDTSKCHHLHQGHGAVDTIVRLPESCGKGPFARVANIGVHPDQSIPASLAPRIVRRDGSQPQVQAITLDTDYAAVDHAKTGAVHLAIQGVNVPGLGDVLDNNIPSSQRRSRLNRRQFNNFVSDAANSMSNAMYAANTIDINKSKALPAADFSKQGTLFHKSLSCPPISASLSVDVAAKGHVVVTLGAAATGTIAPPSLTDFSIIASLTADLTGTIDLKADLSGTLDSGSIKLFETGIPGLDFPGILSIGPTFEVSANVKATLDLNVDASIGLNYHVKKAQLFFPPKGKRSGGSFSLGDTPLKLSADTKAPATGTVEGHVIPSINLGISALGGVKATVFLNLDASATISLKVDAKADASATFRRANFKRQDDDNDSGSSEFDDGSSDDSGEDFSADSTTSDFNGSGDFEATSADSSDDVGGTVDFDLSTDEPDINADDSTDDFVADSADPEDTGDTEDSDSTGSDDFDPESSDPSDDTGAANDSEPTGDDHDISPDDSDSTSGSFDPESSEPSKDAGATADFDPAVDGQDTSALRKIPRTLAPMIPTRPQEALTSIHRKILVL